MRSARSRWTRYRRRTPGIPACRWAWPRSRIALWHRHLRHNPANPQWADRDRFVLSNGHGSMLLYALLHLTGYDLPLDELKRFRQLGSMTPGHPEHGIAPGVETTTGPLGQGLANAVGMALAERLLAAEFNRPGYDDRRSLHVRLRRRRLPDGGHLARGVLARRHAGAGQAHRSSTTTTASRSTAHVKSWFTDDTPKRFEAYGWHVVPDVDGHDVEAVDAAHPGGAAGAAAVRASSAARR